jgi:hypothetical protein
MSAGDGFYGEIVVGEHADLSGNFHGLSADVF